MEAHVDREYNTAAKVHNPTFNCGVAVSGFTFSCNFEAMDRKLKTHTVEEAWKRMVKYCAWQERCHQETRNKVYALGLPKDEVEAMMARLIEENFLNEERFARHFAGGKFRTKKWGRVRIVNELKKRQISHYCLTKALNEISEEDYRDTLQALISQKLKQHRSGTDFVRNGKAAMFCIGKGYEPDLVWEILNKTA